jgi:hypothetical protein
MQIPWGEENLADNPMPLANPLAVVPASVVTTVFRRSKKPKKVERTSLGLNWGAYARAFKVIGPSISSGREYTGEFVVGVDPSSV